MTLAWIFLLIYTLSLGFIFFFSLAQFHLTMNYWFKKKVLPKPNALDLNKLPQVCIQLPVYNEKYVIERLIDSVIQIEYPKDKLQILVLDDSTDETTTLAKNKIDQLVSQGFDIELIRRPERVGYKAGALKYALPLSKGKYIAIFDADFLPKKEFLLETIPYLEQDSTFGVVQSRWGHLNEKYSLITRLQAFALNAHFTVEQVGRNSGNHFINFNGTGGVWRKETIVDAGDWEDDTLTEDLDLSYRSQMKGWKFLYLQDLVSPAELPVTMNELKAQQRRWNKGAAETAKKHLGNVWSSKSNLLTKFHGTMHLLNSSIFVAFILASLISVPLLFMKDELGDNSFLFRIASLFLFSMLSLTLFYATSFFALRKFTFVNLIKFFVTFPLLLSLSMGLALHNCTAVLEGFSGRKTPFVRTPKYSITSEKGDEKWKSNSYRAKSISLATWLEGVLALYFAFGLYYGISHHNYDLVLLHSLNTFGFLSIFGLSIKHAVRK